MIALARREWLPTLKGLKGEGRENICGVRECWILRSEGLKGGVEEKEGSAVGLRKQKKKGTERKADIYERRLR